MRGCVQLKYERQSCYRRYEVLHTDSAADMIRQGERAAHV